MTALLLAFLVGGATFLTLYRLAAFDATLALAAGLLAAGLFEAVRDTLRNRRRVGGGGD